MPEPLYDTRPDKFVWEPWPGPNDWTTLEWFEFAYIQVSKSVTAGFIRAFGPVIEHFEKIADALPSPPTPPSNGPLSNHSFGRSFDFNAPKRATVPPPLTRNHGPRPRGTFDRRGRRRY
jgi:hypothetical protein